MKNFVKNKALIGYLVLAFALGGGTTVALTRSNNNAEELKEGKPALIQTCNVQKRGIEANVYLLGFAKAVRKLLSPIPGRKEEPPPPALQKVIDELNANLDNYIAIQKLQPKTRHCPKQ